MTKWGWPIVLAIGLMAFKSITWFSIVRYHASLTLNLLYIIFTCLMIWSYILAMTISPNQTIIFHESINQHSIEIEQQSTDNKKHTIQQAKDSIPRYCERCDIEKPCYVHHCSVCDMCIFRMDHHCPWTGNCVSDRNKKFFLLFLIYTTLSCGIYNIMTTPLVQPENKHLTNASSVVFVSWILSLVVAVLLGMYTAFHCYLLHTGQTTLQFLRNQPGEFHKKGFIYNMHIYFGSSICTWWIPITPGTRSFNAL